MTELEFLLTIKTNDIFCLREEYVQLRLDDRQKMILRNTFHVTRKIRNKYITYTDKYINMQRDRCRRDRLKLVPLESPKIFTEDIIEGFDDSVKYDKSIVIESAFAPTVWLTKVSYGQFLNNHVSSRPEEVYVDDDFTHLDLDVTDSGLDMNPEGYNTQDDGIYHTIKLGDLLGFVDCERFVHNWEFPDIRYVRYLTVIYLSDYDEYFLRFRYFVKRVSQQPPETGFGVGIVCDGLHCVMCRSDEQTPSTIFLKSVPESLQILNDPNQSPSLSVIRDVNDELITWIETIIKLKPQYIVTQRRVDEIITASMKLVLKKYGINYGKNRHIYDFINYIYASFMNRLENAAFRYKIPIFIPKNNVITSGLFHCSICNRDIRYIGDNVDCLHVRDYYKLYKCGEPGTPNTCPNSIQPFDFIEHAAIRFSHLRATECDPVGKTKIFKSNEVTKKPSYD